MNGIIYTRVSTEEQAKNGYSLPHQKSISNHYCKVNNITVLRHFEENFSAKDFDSRPVFNQLLDYVKLNHKIIDTIVFTKWDRFSRNLENSLKMIKYLRSLGISVTSIEHPMDMTNPDNKLMLSFYLTMPEIENDKISIRTLEGMRKGMMQGCFMGIAPKGYINSRNANNDSTLTPDEIIAPLIRQAFEEFSLGIDSAEQIRKKFCEKGLVVSKQTFLNILKNPVYTGKIVVKAWKKEDVQVVEGLHVKIISEELFDKVQTRFSGKQKSNITKDNDEEFPLRGYLICECHGKKLTGSSSTSQNGSKHAYYHGNRDCNIRFSTKLAHEKLNEYLRRFHIKPEIENLYKEFLKEAFVTEEVERLSRVTQLKKILDLSENRLSSLKEKWLDNEISSDDYKPLNTKLTQEIAAAKMEIEQLQKRKDKLTEYLEFGISFLSSLPEFYNSSPVNIKRKIIGSIFPQKLIFSNQNYRTTEINQFVSLLFSNGEGWESLENKKADISIGLSNNAPPLGLEPRTL